MTAEEILKGKLSHHIDDYWSIPFIAAMKEYAHAECKNVVLWLMYNERALTDTSDCGEIMDEYYKTHKGIST